MGVLDALRDADLERGTLLSPEPTSSSSSSSSSSSAPSSSSAAPSAPHALSSVASRIFWTVAFYAPSAVLPLAARLLVVYRDEAVVGLASLARGAAFGCLQDAAVFFQSLVIARVVLAGRDVLLTSRACCRNALVYATAAVALALAYLCMTLACLVDLSLLLNYLPRLNRGFVAMYLHFAAQFASSLQDAVTVNMAVGFVFYVGSMALWTAAVLLDKVQLPAFGLPAFCQPAPRRAAAPNGDAKPQAANSAVPRPPPQRKAPTIASVGLFSWALHALLTSLTLRTLCVALMVSVSALHATLSLDGNGSDIHFLSNAMFSLEAEDFLKTAQAMQLSSGGGTGDASAAARVLSFQPCLERVIGPTESYLPADGGLHRDKYPLWRKTLAFKGEKRFEVRTHRSKPPNVILLNLESMRSREIGVVGGRKKKARFNQTVTPFFDELSKTGVLFREHYTPSIQTSRTLLSSLFGVLPSLTDETAVNKAFKTTLRLHGLPQILKEALHYSTVFWSAVDLAWDHWREFFQTHGFDTLVDEKGVLEHLSQARRDALTDNDRFSWGIHDPVSFEALENFLEARRVNERNGPPLFLDVYSITSHDPFPTPPNFTASSNYSAFVTKDNKGYLDALNFVDQQLDRLITNLRAKKLLDNTIVLIEGDHGYGRMEHGNNPTIASSKVYEEATHIPLLILADDLLREQDKGLVVDDVSSQTDLLATVADMLGLRGFMQHGVGQSLMRKPPAPQHPDDPALPRGVVLENPYDGRTIGARVGHDLKYVRFGSGKFSVFNLTSDPREVAPVETGHVDKGFRNATTEMFIRYASQVVDMTQFMYETDSFVAPPLRKKAAAAQANDKPLSAAPKAAQ